MQITKTYESIFLDVNFTYFNTVGKIEFPDASATGKNDKHGTVAPAHYIKVSSFQAQLSVQHILAGDMHMTHVPHE